MDHLAPVLVGANVVNDVGLGGLNVHELKRRVKVNVHNQVPQKKNWPVDGETNTNGPIAQEGRISGSVSVSLDVAIVSRIPHAPFS